MGAFDEKKKRSQKSRASVPFRYFSGDQKGTADLKKTERENLAL